MKKLFILIFLVFFSGTGLILPQWNLKTNGIPDAVTIGWAIDACDNNTAIISVSYFNSLFMTTDAGENWYSRIVPENSISDVSMIDAENIWIGSPSGKIYRSTDGGINWVKQYDNSSETNFINYIEMFTENWGVAMGDGPSSVEDPAAILKTQSGGEYWHYVNNSAFGGWSGDMWRRIDFIDMNIGYFYASGLDPQKLYKTIDGGYNWQATSFGEGARLVKFYNESIGFVESYPDELYKTINGGNTWEVFHTNAEGWPNDFEFLPGNPNFVWYTTLSGLYYSTDMGETWTEYYLTDEDLRGRDIVFTDDNHGWLLCDNGRVYYTDNNGGIVTDVDDNMYSNIPSSFQLNQNYPNPFNPTTVISFHLPASSHAVLKVYDVLGNEVATLIDEYKSPGTYEVTFNGSDLSSGIYLYTVQAGNLSETKKLVLMK
ncbi:T9SS type A sorting domain-containing protein [Bacteroidota bacterium]